MGSDPLRAMVVLAVAVLALAAGTAGAASTFINEFHYDNSGTDVGEAVEIVGPAGSSLAGWSLVLYNGVASQRSPYDTIALGGVFANQQGGFGTLGVSFPSNGIQNGSPDGMALVDPSSTVVQFLSYEGSFTAASGPAAGLTSVDIGVQEGPGTAIGSSLQLVGMGMSLADFLWSGPTADSFGAVNAGQTLMAVAPFINEFHYDNSGVDLGEAIEIAGLAGTDLGGWSLVLYNGASSIRAPYDTLVLSGILPDQQAGFGTLSFSYPVNGIQNGSPDGIALVNPLGQVVEFLSYEGAFTALSGPAAGLVSMDVGFGESGGTPAGFSLQRKGFGSGPGAFLWSPAGPETFGLPNDDQIFVSAVIPEPGSLLLLGGGMVGLALLGRRRLRRPCGRVLQDGK